jgi:pimeloyl-ACP methyl ester carboxylesterase
VGVLFLNPGFLPRSGLGDGAVYWADSIAQYGYPCFRFDLPGLGDSDGDLPAEMIDLVHLLNAGCYAPLLSATAANLAERFNLTGLVVVGHCAGAASAIYAADAGPAVKGLILLDPYFYLQGENTSIRRALCSKAAGEKPVARIGIGERLKYLTFFRGGDRLPKNVNLPLIESWRRLASAGLPMLILTAHQPRPHAEEFDYLRFLQASSPRAPHVTVDGLKGRITPL